MTKHGIFFPNTPLLRNLYQAVKLYLALTPSFPVGVHLIHVQLTVYTHATDCIYPCEKIIHCAWVKR